MKQSSENWRELISGENISPSHIVPEWGMT